MDPEQFHHAIGAFRSPQLRNVYSRLGILSIYHPRNSSGGYDLVLSQQAHYMVACRLLEFFRQQYDDGLCSLPHESCFTHFKLNGKEIHVINPYKIILPWEGVVEVNICSARTGLLLCGQCSVSKETKELGGDKMCGSNYISGLREVNEKDDN